MSFWTAIAGSGRCVTVSLAASYVAWPVASIVTSDLRSL